MKKLFFILLMVTLFNSFDATAVTDVNPEGCDVNSRYYCPTVINQLLDRSSKNLDNAALKTLIPIIAAVKFHEGGWGVLDYVRPNDQSKAHEQVSKAIELIERGVAQHKITRKNLQDMVNLLSSSMTTASGGMSNTTDTSELIPAFPKTAEWLVQKFNLKK